jgi:hypothetical protein
MNGLAKKAFFVLAGIVLTVLPLSANGQGLTWWVEHAAKKVMQDRAPQPRYEVEIASGRNMYEPFQVVLRADGDTLMNVDAEISDLIGPDGAIIPAEDVNLYRAMYVTVQPGQLSGDTGDGDGLPGDPRDPGEYPDPLIPFFDPYSPQHPAVGTPFNIKRNTLQPVFGDVRIPADAAAGVYAGTLTVTSNFIVAAEIPVYLTVHRFSMAPERRVATTFHLYDHKIPQYWGGPGPVQDEDQIRRVAKNFENLLHEFMIDLTDPWEDPNPLRDEPLLDDPFFQFDGNTLLPPDYTEFDTVVGPRLDGSYYANGVPAVAFNSTIFGPGNDDGPQTDLTDDQYVLAARDFARHLKEKGWWERIFVYASDEPYLDPGKVEAIAYDSTLMRIGDPDWKERIMVTNHWMPELNDSAGIWCVQLQLYDNWSRTLPEYGREDYQRLMQEGDKLWFYFTNGAFPPYPTYDIDTIHGHEPLIMNWGAWYEGATGLLHWSANAWRDEPWVKLKMDSSWWARNGDGFVTWPGDYNGTRGITPGTPLEVRMEGPIISHRLLMIRESLEDWEIFLMVEDMGGGAFARSVVKELVYRQLGTSEQDFDPDDPPWTLDENDIYNARAIIAAWIEGRLSPGAGRAAGGPGSGDNEVGCSLGPTQGGTGAGSFALALLLIAAAWLGWRRLT